MNMFVVVRTLFIKFSSVLFNLIFISFISNKLGADEFGQYSYYISFCLIFSVVYSFGVSRGFLYDRISNCEHGSLSSLMSLMIMQSLFVFLISLFSFYFFFELDVEVVFSLSMYASIMYFISAAQNIFSIEDKIECYQIIYLFMRLIAMTAVVMLSMYITLDFKVVIFVVVSSSLLASYVMKINIGVYDFYFNLENQIKKIKESKWLYFDSVNGVFISTASTIITANLLSYTDAGHLAFSLQIFNALAIVATVIQQFVIKGLAKDEDNKGVIIFGFGILIISVVFIYFLWGFYLNEFADDSYHGQEWILHWMLFFIPFTYLNKTLIPWFIGKGFFKFVALQSFISSIVGVLFSILLVPYFEMPAAVIGAMLPYVVSFTFFIYFREKLSVIED